MLLGHPGTGACTSATFVTGHMQPLPPSTSISLALVTRRKYMFARRALVACNSGPLVRFASISRARSAGSLNSELSKTLWIALLGGWAGLVFDMFHKGWSIPTVFKYVNANQSSKIPMHIISLALPQEISLYGYNNSSSMVTSMYTIEIPQTLASLLYHIAMINYSIRCMLSCRTYSKNSCSASRHLLPIPTGHHMPPSLSSSGLQYGLISTWPPPGTLMNILVPIS